MSATPALHSIPSEGTIAPPWGTFAPTGGRAFWIKLGQTTPLGKGSLRRTWVKRLREAEPRVDMELSGAKLRLYLGDNRSEIKALQQSDRFMSEERDLIRLAAQRSEDPVYIVDIGANAGLFTAMAGAELTDRAHVLAVEPNPVLLDRLKDNSLLSKAAQIEIAAVAIGGASDCELQLAYHADDLGGASIAEGQLSGAVQHMSVPVKTLASLLETVAFPRLDVMKIDVEGFEDQALVPFFEATDPALWPKVILMEVAHQARWAVPLVDLLKRAGYRAEKDDGSADIQLFLEVPGKWPGTDKI